MWNLALKRGIEETWIWNREGNEIYSVRSGCSRIRNELRGMITNYFLNFEKQRHCF